MIYCIAYIWSFWKLNVFAYELWGWIDRQMIFHNGHNRMVYHQNEISYVPEVAMVLKMLCRKHRIYGLGYASRYA